jgi:hypothetical protein
MKFFAFFFCIVFSVSSFSQNGFDEIAAQKIIDTFFEGFHKGDTVLMKSVMAKDIVMQTAFTNKSGNDIVHQQDASAFVKAIAKRPTDQKWDERLSGYKVEMDGNLAHVWTPYEFWFNGNFSHCGANSFTLAKLNDGWKIIHIIDSRRKENCN